MTSKTSAPAEVYAEQLSRLNYGFPLWHPDPPNDAPEIQIGDVGFVRDGAFYRMFNATQPGDSLINGGHVPPGHEPFEFRTDKSFIKIRDAIGKGPLSSKTIEKVAIKGSAGESRYARFYTESRVLGLQTIWALAVTMSPLVSNSSAKATKAPS